MYQINIGSELLFNKLHIIVVFLASLVFYSSTLFPNEQLVQISYAYFLYGNAQDYYHSTGSADSALRFLVTFQISYSHYLPLIKTRAMLLHAYDINTLQKKVENLERQAKELEDSILYASRLQKAILPHNEVYSDTFADAFTYYRPKDIVGGDFHWIYNHDQIAYFAVGDCTGHGVPGAMVSMSGMAMLRQIIRIKGLSKPAAILSRLDEEITGLFNENLTQGVARDGIDMALCRYDKKNNKMSYAGAGRPLLLIRDGELHEFASAFVHIGYFDGSPKNFNEVNIELKQGDQFYMFSDGFTDQFGGEKVKKFNRKRFRNLILSVSEMPMKRQLKELDAAFCGWKGQQEQIDDVCVLGIKI